MKLFPILEFNFFGQLLFFDVNCRKTAKQAAVVKSDTISKRTALLAKQINIVGYAWLHYSGSGTL